MDVYVNRFRRFESAQSNGYDFLIPDSNVWDRQVKQWVNLFISEGKQRNVSFLAPISNDYGKKFVSFGTIKPDTEGKYDRNGRLNYWADVALINAFPQPPFALDVPLTLSCISAHLDECERSGVSVQRDLTSLLVRKLSSPALLKLHNNATFADNCLHTIADFYSYRDKRLVIILDDDSNYDKFSATVCKAIFESAPITKQVYYISYTDNIARLFNNSACNLFCVPVSEKNNIPQDKSVLVINLAEGIAIKSAGRPRIKDILKCGLMSDFNLFVSDRKDDHTIAKLLKHNCQKSTASLVYLYTNFRGLIKLKPDDATEANIIDYIRSLG